jgi:hypothetical protein
VYPCGAGNFCPQGSSAPTPCVAGTFGLSTTSQSASCDGPCPPGMRGWLLVLLNGSHVRILSFSSQAALAWRGRRAPIAPDRASAVGRLVEPAKFRLVCSLRVCACLLSACLQASLALHLARLQRPAAAPAGLASFVRRAPCPTTSENAASDSSAPRNRQLRCRALLVGAWPCALSVNWLLLLPLLSQVPLAPAPRWSRAHNALHASRAGTANKALAA